MKRTWFLAALALLWSLSATAVAQDESKNEGEEAGKALSLQVDGGKIVIIDEDGEAREIEIPNARSITVTRQVESKNVNGQQETKSVGKAVIIGPDGKKTEIDLSGPIIEMPDIGEALLSKVPLEAIPMDLTAEMFSGPISKFYLGVNCEPVSEALRSQLKLADDQGLIVIAVSDESPAAKSGIERHDILLYANDSAVSSLQELAKVVDEVGEQDGEVSISLLRGGEEKSVKVKPAKRESRIVADVELEGNPLWVPDERGGPAILRGMQPGIILGGVGDAEEAMREVETQMKKLQEELGQLGDFREDMDRARAEIEKAREEMKAAMEEAMREMREEMKRQAQELKDDGGV